jgi:hypothetical protein
VKPFAVKSFIGYSGKIQYLRGFADNIRRNLIEQKCYFNFTHLVNNLHYGAKCNELVTPFFI